MSDFAGTEYDFAAGSLYGLRGWEMDELGRLHGVTHAEVWRPGENVSVCKQQLPTEICPDFRARRAEAEAKASEAFTKSRKARKKDVSHELGVDFSRYFIDNSSWLGGGVVQVEPQNCGDPACQGNGVHIIGTRHHFDATCHCGFWAYDESGFKPHGKVIGVIEAFGKTTIGTKGFRAEKARIVGLCRAGSDGKPLSKSVLSRLADLYPEVMFYDDLDLLIEAHAGVLHSWPEVDESFWSKPVKVADEMKYTFMLGGSGSQYFTTSSPVWRTGGVL